MNPYPDPIITSPFTAAELEMKGLILGRTLEPKAKLPNFAGNLVDKHVFWIPGQPVNQLLLYVKNELGIQRTPLNVEFVNQQKPTRLLIWERMVAWKIDPRSSAKILLKA